MVNANFPRPDQLSLRLDLGALVKFVAERMVRENPAEPKAKGKAKMYPEVAKVPETKASTKEEPLMAIVLYNRCQCEVALEVASPKSKETTKETTNEPSREPMKDQVQVGGPRSFRRNMITSLT
ncbi:hypothetical protein L3X38_004478 [Prunus dulcis]|uniref:Uncharacterized protein n=1 Tax=Prunus dulcis TaxID=3755 RepID=A0AAD5F373_PRUDU|nr:hypothetical protein L3X38_004478 [Prunus dulcis]